MLHKLGGDFPQEDAAVLRRQRLRAVQHDIVERATGIADSSTADTLPAKAAMPQAARLIGGSGSLPSRTRAIELQGVIADALGQVVEAREAHVAQIDRLRSLEAEVAQSMGR